MNAGRALISVALLKHILDLPSGHEVLSIQESRCFRDCIEITISGPLMPEVEEHTFPPVVSLTYQRPEAGLPARLVKIDAMDVRGIRDKAGAGDLTDRERER